MKTILVLTDFSKRADNAAYYALALAKKIKANLLVCSVFMEPSIRRTDVQPSWPIEDYETFWEGSVNDVNKLTDRLNKQLDSYVVGGEFRPLIEHTSMTGFLAETMNEIAAGHQIIMAVIGMYNADGLTPFLLRNSAREIIEKANYPVLLVPYQEKFSCYKKIAFATDLTDSDINVLHSLSTFAKYLSSEILVAHVTPGKAADRQEQNLVKRFLKLASSGINYPMIHYRAIYNASVTAGLQWLSQHSDIDLLVVIHRKKGFVQRLFAGSISQNMAKRLAMPVLVFPCSERARVLPVF